MTNEIIAASNSHENLQQLVYSFVCNKHTQESFLTKATFLDHSVDELANEDLMVTVVTTLVEVVELLAETASGGVELEGPEEVRGLLEVRTHGVDLMNEVFNREDTVLAEDTLDLLVVNERNTLTVQLSITALVDEVTDGLEVGVTVGNVGLDETEHFAGSLVQTNEDSVVDLTKAEKSEDLLDLGRNLVNTTNTNDNGKTAFTFNEEVTVVVSFSSLGNEVSLELFHYKQTAKAYLSVFLFVLLASLDHGFSLSLGFFDASGKSLFSFSLEFSITTLLKKDGLRAT